MRAGTAAAGRARREIPSPATLDDSLSFLTDALARPTGAHVGALISQIREKMQRHCLVEKTHAGLSEALEAVLAARRELEADLALTPETVVEGLGARNLAYASELMLRACLHRRETRSGHYRLDHPDMNDADFRRSFVMRRDADATIIEPHDY